MADSGFRDIDATIDTREGINTAQVKVAVASGLKNAFKLCDEVRAKKEE